MPRSKTAQSVAAPPLRPRPPVAPPTPEPSRVTTLPPQGRWGSAGLLLSNLSQVLGPLCYAAGETAYAIQNSIHGVRNN